MNRTRLTNNSRRAGLPDPTPPPPPARTLRRNATNNERPGRYNHGLSLHAIQEEAGNWASDRSDSPADPARRAYREALRARRALAEQAGDPALDRRSSSGGQPEGMRFREINFGPEDVDADDDSFNDSELESTATSYATGNEGELELQQEVQGLDNDMQPQERVPPGERQSYNLRSRIPRPAPAPAPAPFALPFNLPAMPTPLGVDPNIWQGYVQGMVASANAFGQQQAQAVQPLASLRPPTPPRRPRIKEPSPFDGTSAEKLRTFLSECSRAFRADSRLFRTDEDKINFAVQYLSGAAEQWFHPYLDVLPEDDDAPALVYSWASFTEALEANFGLADPVANAESAIGTMVMTDSERIAAYNVAFTTHSSFLDWNDPPLRRAYWRGLADRLKRKIDDVRPELRNLSELRALATDIDNRYWRNKEDRARQKQFGRHLTGESSSRSSSNSNSNSGNSNNSRSNNSNQSNSRSSNNPQRNQHASSNQQRNNNSNSISSSNTQSTNTQGSNNQNRSNNNNAGASGSNQRPQNTNQSAPKNTNSLTGKLTSDGKLTDEERNRRFREGLCMICGKKGHMKADCPARKRRKEKLRAAATGDQATEPDASTSPPLGLPARLGAVNSQNQLILSAHIPYSSTPFRLLLDCGATDSFIDQAFALTYNIPTHPLAQPRPLILFDGSLANNLITQYAEFPVTFSEGQTHSIRFLVTTLDPTASAVLGYSTLTSINPIVDWKARSVTFRTPESVGSPPLSQNSPAVERPESPLCTDQPHADVLSAAKSVHIMLVNAAAYRVASRQQGAFTGSLCLSPSGSAAEVQLCAVSAAEFPEEVEGLKMLIPQEYHDYLDVFSKAKAETLAEHRPFDHKIDLVDGATPPLGPIYSLSEAEQIALRDFIAKHLANGFIRQSSAPCGAPVLFVKKKNGELRLCVDYRGLNKITKKDRYPLPLIPNLINRLHAAKCFTKFDLRGAYHLVRIAEGDEWKTTFRTRYGSFEFCVVPEGLCNAPATFQRFMNTIFSDLLDVSVIVYLDDILIFSNDPAEHEAAVREVLKRLRKHGLFVKAEKCTFASREVEFLGFICTDEGVKMDDAKVKTIKEWPTPKNVRDIQSFLGFANFYRRFISDYSRITVPLTRLTRKDARWDWSQKCQDSFDSLKRAFTTAPILVHWKPGAQLIVETDASDYAVAGIISMVADDGEIHPIAFHSRTLTGAELNYDTHDKELLAIYEAFVVWRHYLEGATHVIDVVTDHKNLKYFSTTKMLTRRQARWSEYLSAFNLLIRFRPGKLGAKPDALTRRTDVYSKRGDSGFANANPQNFKPIFGSEQIRSNLRATYYAPVALRAATMIDFDELRSDILESLPNDTLASSVLASLDSPQRKRWTISDSGLLLHDQRVYVPDATPARGNLRMRVLQLHHDHPTAGHFGQTKTTALVKREYYWPELRDDVVKFIKSCVPCSRNKAPRHKPYGLLKPLPVPERPWHSISMDFIEKLPESKGHTQILVVVDRLTKQAIFIPCPKKFDSMYLATLFVQHVFSKHGIPSHVTSDRGSRFVSAFMTALGTLLDMKLHATSGYHPEADGQTERVNQTLEQYLRMYCNYQQDNWSELLPLAEFAYNNAPNATTGVSPFYANKGYNPQIAVHPERDAANYLARNYAVDLEALHRTLRREMKSAQDTYERNANRHRLQGPDLRVGNKVFVKAKFLRSTRPTPKLSERYYGPYTIVDKPSSQSFTLELPSFLSSVHPTFHISQLEPHTPNSFPGQNPEPPAPEELHGEPAYEVSEILDSKWDRRFKPQRLLYNVRWKGYEGTAEEFGWTAADDFEDDDSLVLDFHRAYPRKPGYPRIRPYLERAQQ
ncbi:hypothetical protein FRC17_010364 [Serendipita sp. 399]|nr:hypothetical protein FRC17_010364 [Serendipita sp. 399]